jgi:threonine aldolase
MARVAGLMPHVLSSKNGILDPEVIRAAIRSKNVHYPKPGLICVENTHNSGGGTVYPLLTLQKIRDIADEHKLKFHMDGARVFNAAAYLDIPVKEITKYVDSVMFCLSKGLSSPVGSMLCGSEEFIDKALHARKMLGGGMRQVGVLAAAGIISLNEMPDQLKIDHKNARKLAIGLNQNDDISIDLDNIQTNLVFFNINGKMDAYDFAAALKERYNIWCDVKSATRVRMVTNRHVTEEIVDHVLKCVNEVLA